MRLWLSGWIILWCGLSALAGQTAEVRPTLLRVGKIGPFTLDEKSPSWTIEIGRERGFFQREGLEIQFVLTSGFDSQLEGLLEGAFEIGHQSASQLIAAITAGAPLFMFMGDRRGPVFTLMASPSIRTIGDLRGQVLGSSGPTGTDHLPLIKMLSSLGLAPGDYRISSSGNVLSRLRLLEKGIIAATLLSGDLVAQGMSVGLRNLGEADPHLGEFSFSAAAARRDWAASHEELLGAYIRAYLRSVRWLLDPSNREQALTIMKARAELDENTALRIYRETLERLLPSGRLTETGTRAVVEVMVQAGLIAPGPHPVGGYVDLSFLQAARASRGAE